MDSNTKLKVSVVLATYNGAEYIEEQLISIYNQTQKVEEVLIFDDRSTDNTVEICKTFIEKNKLDNWSISVNQTQSGVFHNFINGAFSSNGDVIFFADQDDIWLADKVKTMVDEFKTNPDILSLTTTFSRFEGRTILSSHVKHPNRKNNGLKNIDLNDFCNFFGYLGMSMAISKDLMQKIDKDLSDQHGRFLKDTTHDIYFNFISTLFNGLYHLDKVLTKRRSYDDSVSNKLQKQGIELYKGSRELYIISERIKKLKCFKNLMRELPKVDINNVSRFNNIIEKHTQFNIDRYNYLNHSSVSQWVKNIFLIKLYPSIPSYLNDGKVIFQSRVL